MSARVLLVYLGCCLLWGSTWLVNKLGLADVPPLLFGALRMLLACALLTPLALRQRPAGLEARTLWRLAGVGVLQLGVSYALLFVAQRHLDSALAAVLFAIYPVWVVGFAHLLLPGERATLKQLGAGALALAGVGVLQAEAFEGLSAAGALSWAALLPVAGAGVSALANVGQKRLLSHVPPAFSLWVQSGVAGLFFLLVHGALQPDAPLLLSPRAVASLLYLAAFGTVVTFLCFFWLLPRLPMVAVGVIPLLDTTVAIALGALVLDEPFGARQGLGAALVMAGALAANLVPPSAASVPPPVAEPEPVPEPAPAAAPAAAVGALVPVPAPRPRA
jgi:drug/metabolite transporter (DMT)-like permease